MGDDVRLVLRFRRGRRSLCAPAALLSLVNPSEEGIFFFFRRGRSDGGAKTPVSILLAVKICVQTIGATNFWPARYSTVASQIARDVPSYFLRRGFVQRELENDNWNEQLFLLR